AWTIDSRASRSARATRTTRCCALLTAERERRVQEHVRAVDTIIPRRVLGGVVAHTVLRRDEEHPAARHVCERLRVVPRARGQLAPREAELVRGARDGRTHLRIERRRFPARDRLDL